MSCYSFPTFDEVTVHILAEMKPRSILDIGAGDGKYGRLVARAGIDTHLVAVECDPTLGPGLRALGYSAVREMTAQQLFDAPAAAYDLVILGDVIEHFKHSDGRDLLEFLNYRCSYILVVTPECMPMGSPVFHHGHNSLWTPREMEWHDWWAHARHRVMHFYLLRGMLNWEAATLPALVASVNERGYMLGAEEGSVPSRCELKIQDRRIIDETPGQPGVGTFYRPL
jgi:hypothetical protein